MPIKPTNIYLDPVFSGDGSRSLHCDTPYLSHAKFSRGSISERSSPGALPVLVLIGDKCAKKTIYSIRLTLESLRKTVHLRNYRGYGEEKMRAELRKDVDFIKKKTGESLVDLVCLGPAGIGAVKFSSQNTGLVRTVICLGTDNWNKHNITSVEGSADGGTTPGKPGSVPVVVNLSLGEPSPSMILDGSINEVVIPQGAKASGCIYKNISLAATTAVSRSVAAVIQCRDHEQYSKIDGAVLHKRGVPIVLVQGYVSTKHTLLPLQLKLRLRGFDAYLSKLGFLMLGDVNEQVRKLDKVVKRVMAIHNCDKVDLVGVSLGGVCSLYYSQGLGKGNVRRIVTLGTPFRGSPMATWNSPYMKFLGKSIDQIKRISKNQFLRDLNEKGIPEELELVTSISMNSDNVCPPKVTQLEGARCITVPGPSKLYPFTHQTHVWLSPAAVKACIRGLTET